MDWSWLIPVVAVAIWIIGQVARNAAEQQKKPGQRPAAARPRNAKSDIERFLEEINQRRQQQQRQQTQQQQQQPRRQQPASQPSATSGASRPAQERRPAETSRPKPVTRTRPEPARPRPAEPPVLARVLAPPPASEPPMIALPADARAVEPQVVAAAFLDPRTAAMPIQRPIPTHLTEVRRLLKGPQSLKTAFVLTEILGVPRSRRRRR